MSYTYHMCITDYDTAYESVDQVDGGSRTDSRMKLKRNTVDEVEEDDDEEEEKEKAKDTASDSRRASASTSSPRRAPARSRAGGRRRLAPAVTRRVRC